MDSRTYTPQIAAGGVILTNGDTILSAANGARPYLILRPPAGNTVTIRPQVAGSELTIDGLWIGVAPETGATGPTTLLIDGAWRKVTLRNVTIDPGGLRAAAAAAAAVPIPAVTLDSPGRSTTW